MLAETTGVFHGFDAARELAQGVGVRLSVLLGDELGEFVGVIK